MHAGGFAKSADARAGDAVGFGVGTQRRLLCATPFLNFTIPATNPPGKFLLHFEHIFTRKQNDSGIFALGAQYCTNCARINLINDGLTSILVQLVKIPGVYVKRQQDLRNNYFPRIMNVGVER